jgi:hypothetical protein
MATRHDLAHVSINCALFGTDCPMRPTNVASFETNLVAPDRPHAIYDSVRIHHRDIEAAGGFLSKTTDSSATLMHEA